MKVCYWTVEAAQVGRRIDNALLAQFKGVPKRRIYRALRSGEVRVNKGRVQAGYRLQPGDVVRLPPLSVAATAQPLSSVFLDAHPLAARLCYEDADIIVINKPPGWAAHGGSGLSWGVVDWLRAHRPDLPEVNLVHRLDRETSGALVFGKTLAVLQHLQVAFATRQVSKYYLALVAGAWRLDERVMVDQPLARTVVAGGERRACPAADGQSAQTEFQCLERFHDATLLAASPHTGRMHQIRVHAQCLGHPLVGDQKYGDKATNQAFAKAGLRRLFLHAERITVPLLSGEKQTIIAPLDPDWDACIMQYVHGFGRQSRT